MLKDNTMLTKNVTSVKRALCSDVATCKGENEPFVPLCFQPPSTLQDNADKMDQTSSRLSWKQYILQLHSVPHHQRRLRMRLDTAPEYTSCYTKESAPLLCIIMNYHLNVWVGEIFQYYPLCSHLRIFHLAEKAASVTSVNALFTSLPIPLFALLILLHLFFFFHFTPSTLQQ